MFFSKKKKEVAQPTQSVYQKPVPAQNQKVQPQDQWVNINHVNSARNQQQQQMMPQSREQQVESMHQKFQGTEILKSDTNQVSYKVPIRLSISATPLFIKVEIQSTFPQSPPMIQVLARVSHQFLDPKYKMLNHPAIFAWPQHQNLIHILDVVQQEFERQPPIPDSLARQQPQTNNQPQEDDPQVQKNQVPTFKVESQQQEEQKESLGQSLMKGLEEPCLNEVDEKVNQLELPEIDVLKQEEQYCVDYISSIPSMIKYRDSVDKFNDAVKFQAKENIDLQEQINLETENVEAKNEEYTVARGELKDLLASYQQKSQLLQIDQLITCVNKKLYEVQKVSDKIRKQLSKASDPDEVYKMGKEYTKAMQEYYQYEHVKNALLQTK